MRERGFLIDHSGIFLRQQRSRQNHLLDTFVDFQRKAAMAKKKKAIQ